MFHNIRKIIKIFFDIIYIICFNVVYNYLTNYIKKRLYKHFTYFYNNVNVIFWIYYLDLLNKNINIVFLRLA